MANNSETNNGSKRNPPSPSQTKNNKRVWEEKRKLAEERLMSLDNNIGNTNTNTNNDDDDDQKKKKLKKVKILEEMKPLNEEKRIICLPPKAKKTSITHCGPTSVLTPAMERAEEVEANLPPQFPSFKKVMLKSHVYRGFWLGLPRPFCVAHLSERDATIVLVDEKGNECDTKYLAEKNGLSGGWRGFAIAHNLHDGDVIVFQLIETHKFKLYIVRAKDFTEVDGAIGLLNLDPRAKPLPAVEMEDQPEENAKNNEIPSQRYLEHVSNDSEPTSSQHGNESEDNSSAEIVDGIRFSDSPVSFKEVKSFKDFNIHVDGLIIDSEIPIHLRKKYYELCCSQRMFLHESLKPGFNSKISSGLIIETTNIADAIRAFKHHTTGLEDLESWAETLKAFEILGMMVGFLRARIDKLVNFSRDMKAIMELAKNERAELESKSRALNATIKSLDEQIDGLEMKDRELGFVLKEMANDPW